MVHTDVNSTSVTTSLGVFVHWPLFLDEMKHKSFLLHWDLLRLLLCFLGQYLLSWEQTVRERERHNYWLEQLSIFLWWFLHSWPEKPSCCYLSIMGLQLLRIWMNLLVSFTFVIGQAEKPVIPSTLRFCIVVAFSTAELIWLLVLVGSGMFCQRKKGGLKCFPFGFTLFTILG